MKIEDACFVFTVIFMSLCIGTFVYAGYNAYENHITSKGECVNAGYDGIDGIWCYNETETGKSYEWIGDIEN